jgi:hypothetical protein
MSRIAFCLKSYLHPSYFLSYSHLWHISTLFWVYFLSYKLYLLFHDFCSYMCFTIPSLKMSILSKYWFLFLFGGFIHFYCSSNILISSSIPSSYSLHPTYHLNVCHIKLSLLYFL